MYERQTEGLIKGIIKSFDTDRLLIFDTVVNLKKNLTTNLVIDLLDVEHYLNCKYLLISTKKIYRRH